MLSSFMLPFLTSGYSERGIAHFLISKAPRSRGNVSVELKTALETLDTRHRQNGTVFLNRRINEFVSLLPMTCQQS